MTKEEAIKKGILENKTVTLKPLLRAGKMIKDPKHFGYFMFTGAFKNYVLPKNERSGMFIPILTDEELKFFNEEMREDLSFNKKIDNFWTKFSVRIQKTDTFIRDGITYNLADPYENLQVRVLKANKEVAPSYELRDTHPAYRFYFVAENEENMAAAKDAELEQSMWMFLGSVSSSRKKMIDILSVYYAEKARSNELDLNVTKEWLIGEVRGLIKKDPEFILEIMDNPEYEIKAFIIDGVRSGAIAKTGRNKYNIIGDSSNYDYVGITKRIAQLKKDTHDDYLRIKEQIEEYYKDNKIK